MEWLAEKFIFLVSLSAILMVLLIFLFVAREALPVFFGENNTALVKGGTPLSGAPVEAPDIRAGAALVVAALAASGPTEIIGLEYIDRGYERLEEMLSALGGQVQRSRGVTPLPGPTGTFETSEYPRVAV